MKKFIPVLAILLVILTACPHKKDVIDNNGEINTVSQFVYDGLSDYYLWADEIESKKPTYKDTDPEDYFYKILNAVDTKQGWSWITDDVEGLLNEFEGVPKDYGWSLALFKVENSNSVVAVVKFVYPNTPASSAGIIRGNIIDKINGTTLDVNNYQSLLFSTNSITANVYDQNHNNAHSVSITPTAINTNPVFKDSIYQNKPQFASKKIGYLFYTEFIDNYNSKLFDVFSKFKTAGVTDLVLDLRYNHGGDISAATYLASLIAPRAAVSKPEVFTTLTYNDLLNSYFDSHGGRPKAYFVNDNTDEGPNPLDANLNLQNVYIIATDDSYSAAELLTFCLKPFLNVVHIGSKTGGKFTGSFTVTPFYNYPDKNGDARTNTVYRENDLSSSDKAALQTWAMQPIVLKYADKNGSDFENPGYLNPNYSIKSIENDPSNWEAIGSTDDYLLSKAISLITGMPIGEARNNNNTVKRSIYSNSNKRLYSNRENRLKESVRFQVPDKNLNKEILMKLKESHIPK